MRPLIMYMVTNRDQINQIHQDNAPREVEAIVQEHCPGATVDRNGRAHAPYDGYSLDGIDAFRGGEYLPIENNDPLATSLRNIESVRFGIFMYDVAKHRSGDRKNAYFAMFGSRGQLQAVREEAKRQHNEFNETLELPFTDGKREDAELMLCQSFLQDDGMPDEWGRIVKKQQYRDENLNIVYYKGKELVKANSPNGYVADIGRWASIRGTFSHWTAYSGFSGCSMKRPKVNKLLGYDDAGNLREMSDIEVEDDDKFMDCI